MIIKWLIFFQFAKRNLPNNNEFFLFSLSFLWEYEKTWKEKKYWMIYVVIEFFKIIRDVCGVVYVAWWSDKNPSVSHGIEVYVDIDDRLEDKIYDIEVHSFRRSMILKWIIQDASAMLFSKINNFVSYRNLSGNNVKRHKVCHICEADTCYHKLKTKKNYLPWRLKISKTQSFIL